MKGTLYGVGVGPGDPQLLTVKAVETVRRCNIIAVPDSGSGNHVALQIVEQYIDSQEIVYCPLPMTRDAAVQREAQGAVAQTICARLDQGEDVAFLTLGDPGVYATYSYIHSIVARRGYDTKIIPGIPSFCAAAAELGISLCEDNMPLYILPGSDPELKAHLGLPGTKVVMKLGSKLDDIVGLVDGLELTDRAIMVEQCSMPQQRIFTPGEAGDRTGYFTTLIVRGDT